MLQEGYITASKSYKLFDVFWIGFNLVCSQMHPSTLIHFSTRGPAYKGTMMSRASLRTGLTLFNFLSLLLLLLQSSHGPSRTFRLPVYSMSLMTHFQLRPNLSIVTGIYQERRDRRTSLHWWRSWEWNKNSPSWSPCLWTAVRKTESAITTSTQLLVTSLLWLCIRSTLPAYDHMRMTCRKEMMK